MTRTNCAFELISLLRSEHEAAQTLSRFRQFSSDLHFVHTVEGAGVLRVGHRRYAATRHAVLFVPMLEPCSWDKSPGAVWRMINFHCRLFTRDGAPIEQRLAMPVQFAPVDLPRIHRHLARWHDDLWQSEQAALECEAAAGVQALAASYFSQFGRAVTPRRGDDAMLRIRQLIDRRIGETFDAASLAAEMHLSVSQMNRRFNAAFGVAPKAYRQQQRLARAEIILRTRDDKLADIAVLLGFGDVFHFSKWFKSRMGIPPGEYRRQTRTVQA